MISRLAEQPDLSAFLGHIMLEAVAQIGADGGHLTIYDQQRDVISTMVLVEDGEVVQAPSFPPEMPIEEVGFIQLICKTRKLRYFDLEINFEQDAHLLWTGMGEHHKRQHHRTGIAIPLFVGDQFLGHLGLAFVEKKTISKQGTELLQALAHQAALAIQLTQLAEEAKLAAIAREQEKAAQERSAELAKANHALQATIDTLGTLDSLDDFVPAALKIISRTFGTKSCAFYEHSVDNFIYLRYWALENHILHPKDLLELDRDKFAFVRRLAEGAEVPIAYVGDIPLRARKHTLILNHVTGTVVPEFDTFTQIHGWELELNLPLVINGVAEAALCIYRSAGKPFTTNEIALAEALGKQLALALQSSRLAEEAKLAAIARAEEAKLAAILEERNRIAREIHDTLAQGFTGVIMQLEASKRKISSAQLEAAQTHITRARSLATEGLSEARRSVGALRPQTLESRNLPDALCHLAEQMTCAPATQITVQIEGSPYSLPVEVETNLLRIAQEAVTNALRHAQAQTIRINLRFETAAVHLHITDDGQGFDPESQLMNTSFGLIGMQERAQRLGGQFTLTSIVGQGTEIAVSIPI